ncbi:MAG: hypothetical protein ISP90_00290 [Nevskia sp.]|nr:hypothetical protein [Nevskia sp.]
MHRALFLGLFLALSAGSAQAADPTGEALVAHIEQVLWGKTNQGEAEMAVVTPDWQTGRHIAAQN